MFAERRKYDVLRPSDDFLLPVMGARAVANTAFRSIFSPNTDYRFLRKIDQIAVFDLKIYKYRFTTGKTVHREYHKYRFTAHKLQFI